MKKVFLFLSLALACTIVMTSCGKDDDGTVALTSINVSPPSVKAEKGASVTVTATPVPGNATGVSFEWISKDPSIATVDNGKITIVSVGTTTVTVSSGSVSKDIPVEGIVAENPLLEIRVNETEVSLPADDSVQITVTPFPADADNIADYVWTSADDEIATVNSKGWIFINGVGETTVTVINGSVKTDIKVTGTIAGIKVVDPDGETSSSEGFIGTTVQLVAVLLPERLDGVVDLIPEKWESNDETVATVNQLTGEVKLVGKGTAAITATMPDGKQSIYTISTESPLSDVYGYWKFDDPEQFGKATRGSDLEIFGNLTIVEGPSEGNIAVEAEKGPRTFKWLHEKAEADIPAGFTFMWDTRFYAVRQYYSLYWNGNPTGPGDASVFMRWRESVNKDGKDFLNVLDFGRGGYAPIYNLEPSGDSENPALSPWMRLVVVVEIASDYSCKWSVYIDGEVASYVDKEGVTQYLRGYYISSDDDGRFRWVANEPIYFDADGDGGGTDLQSGDGDDAPHPIAAIAAWDRPLTEDEVALLGGVK
ncbi:MAG: Ig-like domain-containing protein [Prevotellaceae bacterium]|nr:Ig-like domain-containing protein [Prevotellaceae bacterium]